MLNQIFNEDCLEWMKRIPDWSIDCIITDPPYWSTACRWDHVIPFEPMWKELKRIIKPNGAIVLFWSEPFSSALRMSNIKQYKYDWIWEKSIPTWWVSSKNMPMKKHETISIFYAKQPIYNPIYEDRENSHTRWKGWKYICRSEHINTIVNVKPENKYRNPTTVLSFNNVSRHKRIHPTQKPVALIEYLIKTYTLEWETVLDFTSGSGTTWIAAQNTNRKYILIEKDKWYYEISKERLLKNKILLWSA